MILRMEYTFNAAQWNEGFFNLKKIRDMSIGDGLQLLTGAHGHNWKACITVDADPDERGYVCDYFDVQAIAAELDFKFLPLTPLMQKYLAKRFGVSVEKLLTMPEWGMAAKLEVVTLAFLEEVIERTARPGYHRVTVGLYETGPDAMRNVNTLYAEETVYFDASGQRTNTLDTDLGKTRHYEPEHVE